MSSMNTSLAPNGSFALWQPHSTYSVTNNASLAGLDMVDARLFWDPVEHEALCSA